MGTDQLQDNELLIEYRKLRKHGDVRRIAKEVGKSETYVSYCLNGHSQNDQILDVAHKLTVERKLQQVRRLKELRQIQ